MLVVILKVFGAIDVPFMTKTRGLPGCGVVKLALAKDGFSDLGLGLRPLKTTYKSDPLKSNKGTI